MTVVLLAAVVLAAATILTAARPAVAATDASSSPSQSARGAPGSVRDWFFISHGAHVRPSVPGTAARLLRRYSGIWIGPRRHKVVYLTFDAAEEFGTMRRLTRVLRRAHVDASFFLTGGYIRAHPKIVRRLMADGHLVCNHSLSHPRMTALAGRPKAFARQLTATERAFHAATGGRLARFFRPPYGTYSARVLALTERLGYVSVFWSFAHVDWERGDQPPVSTTRGRIVAAACPGALYLLHASSTSDIAALPGAIRWLKRRGYEFGSLDELR